MNNSTLVLHSWHSLPCFKSINKIPVTSQLKPKCLIANYPLEKKKKTVEAEDLNYESHTAWNSLFFLEIKCCNILPKGYIKNSFKMRFVLAEPFQSSILRLFNFLVLRATFCVCLCIWSTYRSLLHTVNIQLTVKEIVNLTSKHTLHQFAIIFEIKATLWLCYVVWCYLLTVLEIMISTIISLNKFV